MDVTNVANIQPLTMQQVFDLGVNGFRAQGYVRSKDPITVTCLYRGPNGRACLIGHAVPDSIYHEAMEGCSMMTLFDPSEDEENPPPPNMAQLRALLPFAETANGLEFLSRMQDWLHDGLPDGPTDVERWEREAKLVAEQFGLIYTPPAA